MSSRLIFLCNLLLVFFSISALCLSASIFDFIVASRLYYTVPDHKVLISPSLAFFTFPASILCLIVSLSFILFQSANDKIVKFAINNQMILSFVHAFIICASCILSAYCAFLCSMNANDVAIYADRATPAQFQAASAWYFIRLRALAVFSACQSILNAVVVSVLYLGISCKYRTFAQISNKPLQPDLVERTTYFA